MGQHLSAPRRRRNARIYGGAGFSHGGCGKRHEKLLRRCRGRHRQALRGGFPPQQLSNEQMLLMDDRPDKSRLRSTMVASPPASGNGRVTKAERRAANSDDAHAQLSSGQVLFIGDHPDEPHLISTMVRRQKSGLDGCGGGADRPILCLSDWDSEGPSGLADLYPQSGPQLRSGEIGCRPPAALGYERAARRQRGSINPHG